MFKLNDPTIDFKYNRSIVPQWNCTDNRNYFVMFLYFRHQVTTDHRLIFFYQHYNFLQSLYTYLIVSAVLIRSYRYVQSCLLPFFSFALLTEKYNDQTWHWHIITDVPLMHKTYHFVWSQLKLIDFIVYGKRSLLSSLSIIIPIGHAPIDIILGK